MNRLDQIYIETPDIAGFADHYLTYLAEVMASVSREEIVNFAELMINARKRGARIFFIGNGGSAATASHFANDISIGTRALDKPFRAISLTDNNAVMTAIANDDGYDKVFLQQLQVLMDEGDLLVAISASGNSQNLLDAIDWANANGGITIGLTAFDGGSLKDSVQHYVHVPTGLSEYGPAEDGHMILDHLLGAYLVRRVHDTSQNSELRE